MPRQTVRARALKNLERDFSSAEEFLLHKYLLEDDEKDTDYDADNDEDSIDDLDAELSFLSSKQELEHVQQTRYLAQRVQATSQINIF